MIAVCSRLIGRIAYLFVKSIARLVIDGYFREVTVVGLENIPMFGPVIFIGNHNNQFVDASMLVSVVPRRIRFLIADVSLKRPVIGGLAKISGSIPVKRPQDMIYVGIGDVYWEQKSFVLKGIKTRFLLDVKIGDNVKIEGGSTVGVKEIISDVELATTNAIEGQMSPGVDGVSFSVLPKINQSEVYETVSESLKAGSTIGVFPEGGSHDRTDLLPLKPGVAVMALSSLLEGAEDVMIVPVGLNYFEGHKVLSRATVEIGRPIEMSTELLQDYKENRSAALSKLMGQIEGALRNCIISAVDYKILRSIRLCSTLYPPERMRVAETNYHTLCHLFSRMFALRDQTPQLVELQRNLRDYYLMLKAYGIPDAEVWQLKQSVDSACLLLVEKSVKLVLCIFGALCMIAIWAPMKLISSYFAERHRETAVKKSSVKVFGRDVVASFKIITILILLPLSVFFVGLSIGIYLQLSWRGVASAIICCLLWIPYACYWSHRCSTIILPCARQIRSLSLAILGKMNMWCETEKTLITQRLKMQVMVREAVDSLGPKIADNFMSQIERVVPKSVIEADSRRLQRSRGEFVPLIGRSYFECREEII